MHIQHGVHGGRTVVSEHNGVRVVNRGHGGYVQRAYVTRGGHAYYSRTFYAGGRYHVGLYRGYGWGGHSTTAITQDTGTTQDFMGGATIPGERRFPGALEHGDGEERRGGDIYGGWWNPYPVYAAPYTG